MFTCHLRRSGASAALIALALTLGPSARAECPAPPERVVGSARAAVDALQEGDRDTYLADRDAALAGLACLSAPLDPVGAAVVLRLRGIDAFRERDPGRASGFLRASRQLDPTYELPLELAGEGTLLRMLWDTQPTVPPGTQPIQRSPGYAVTVNGRPAEVVPTDLPYVLVVTAPTGAVVWARVAEQGEAPPAPDAYRIAEPPPPPEPRPPAQQTPEPPRSESRSVAERHTARWVGVGAGAVALGSGALWTAALLSRGAALEQGELIRGGGAEDLSRAAYEADLDRVNRLGYAAEVTTGLALGLGVLTVTLAW